MANKKISELTSYNVPNSNDLFVIVDSTSVQTKKITLESIMASPGDIGTLNPGLGRFTTVRLPSDTEITASPTTGTLTISTTSKQLLFLGNTESVLGSPLGTSIRLNETSNQILLKANNQNQVLIQDTGTTIYDQLVVLGDLFIDGTAFVINKQEITTEDNIITLNSGETGSGVTSGYSGLEIDRGSSTNFQIVFEESTDTFRVGVIGSLQRVALIEDSPVDTYIPFWNNSTNQLDTTNSPIYISGSDTVIEGGLAISDDIITLNNGETGSGVTSGYSGLEIDRGSLTNYQIVFEESSSTLRAGLSTNLQRVALIEDSPVDTYIPFWNNTTKQLDTTNSPIYTSGSEVILPTTPTNGSSLFSLVNKEYVDTLVSSYGLMFYMTDSTAVGTGYKVCSIDVPTDPETYIETPSLSDNDYIDGWISPNNASFTRLLKGIYNYYVNVEKISGNKTLRLYWKLFERKADTTEVEIATSSLSNEISTKSSFTISLQLSEDYVLSSGSRVVGKLYANVTGSGGSPVARIYLEGNTASRWELPWGSNYTFNADTVDNFDASLTPTPNTIVPLNADGILDLSATSAKIDTYTLRRVDLSNATSNYDLQVGEEAIINFTDSTNVPLYIQTDDGTYYQFELVPANTGGTCGGISGDIFLYPNDTTSVNEFYFAEVSESSTGLGSNYFTFSSFKIGEAISSIHCFITNRTVYKNIKGISDIYGISEGFPVICTFSTDWQDTTTPWTSLGTVIFPQETSGTIIIRRIF